MDDAGKNRSCREKRCLEQPLGFVTDIYIYIYTYIWGRTRRKLILELDMLLFCFESGTREIRRILQKKFHVN